MSGEIWFKSSGLPMPELYPDAWVKRGAGTFPAQVCHSEGRPATRWGGLVCLMFEDGSAGMRPISDIVAIAPTREELEPTTWNRLKEGGTVEIAGVKFQVTYIYRDSTRARASFKGQKESISALVLSKDAVNKMVTIIDKEN